MEHKDILALQREMPHAIDTDHCLYRRSLRQKLAVAESTSEIGDVIPHDDSVLSGESTRR